MPTAETPFLGPHVVGTRVVVRRVLPGLTGPTGGPAMTDVLGVCERWGDATMTVRREDGELVEVALADIVSGKPVPPRPAARLRVSPEEAARRAAATWPARSEPLGEWLLREAGGYTKRANSALAVGDPGLPLEEALARVAAHYRGLGLTPRLRAFGDSEVEGVALATGWARDPDDPASELLLGSVARASRLLGRPRAEDPEVVLGDVDDAWLASDERARAHGEPAVGVLAGAGAVLARVGDPVLARGRLAVVGDWAGLASLWTHPGHRGRGLARAVVRALLERAAEQGATTVVLEVAEGQDAVREWYERLGLVTHHTYRYLVFP